MTEATTKPTKLQALNTRIEKLSADLARLTTERDALVADEAAAAAIAEARAAIEVTGLDAYTKVKFFFGRKENRKEYTGEVVAFRPASDSLPAAYKVEVGSGFDTDIKVVPARDVELVEPAVVAEAS